jgi:hypothetical protein
MEVDCYPRPAEPYRAMANLRNIFHKIMASAFFAALLAATHSPRKNLALPQGKLRAFSLPHDLSVQLMFGAARFGEPVLSASRNLGFYIWLVQRRFPASTRHTTQVLQSTANSGRNGIVRRVMRRKRLQRRGFSQASARWRTLLAFGLPQGA